MLDRQTSTPALFTIADQVGEAGVRLVVVTPHRLAVGESADGATLSAALHVERTLAEALA
jgi:hypothetical protein